MENITPEADYYLELGFTKEAGSLSPGGTVEIQLGINTTDWSNYNQKKMISVLKLKPVIFSKIFVIQCIKTINWFGVVNR